MRSFRRPAVVPPTLAAIPDPTTKPGDFPNKWTQPDVKGALYAMQGRICAYCGADISENAVDVEHFRPKGNVLEDPGHGGYWWLAYKLSNYLLSCTICNQRAKRDSFPLRDGARRSTYRTRRQIGTEQRVLLDPVADPLESMVEYNLRDLTEPLRAQNSVPAGEAARVVSSIGMFEGWIRVSSIRKRVELLDKAAEAIDTGNPLSARDDAVRYRSHSLVVWQLLSRNAPAALPTAEQELEWLLRDLVTELGYKLRQLDRGSTTLDDKELNEILYALATLWKDPPAGTSAAIEKFFDDRGLNVMKQKVLEKAATLYSAA
ncbi:MAG: hypothetical protein HY820_42785 [Acidobacteria bacterium]|nr:hypothetical protein [Acidobacteriota bacterium]